MPKTDLQLTARQSQILEGIISETLRTQRILSIREIAELFNMTPKGAMDHLTLIRKKGHIRIEDGKFGVYPVAIKLVRIDE